MVGGKPFDVLGIAGCDESALKLKGSCNNEGVDRVRELAGAEPYGLAPPAAPNVDKRDKRLEAARQIADILGVSERMDAEGLVHDGFELAFDGRASYGRNNAQRRPAVPRPPRLDPCRRPVSSARHADLAARPREAARTFCRSCSLSTSRQRPFLRPGSGGNHLR